MSIIQTKKTTILMKLVIIYFFLEPMDSVLLYNENSILKYYAIVIGIMFLLYFIQNKNSIKINEYTSILFFLIVLSWISVVWASDMSAAVSLNQHYTIMPLLFIMIYSLDFTQNEIEKIEVALVLGGLLLVAYTLYTQDFDIFNIRRITATNEGSPNAMASNLILPIILSIKKILYSGSKRFKYSYFCISIVLVYVFLLTGSRGNLVGLVIGFLFGLTTLKLPKRIKYFSIIGIGALIMFLLAPSILPDWLISRLDIQATVASESQESMSRTNLYKEGISIMKSMPPWGFGTSGGTVELTNAVGVYRSIHNTYLNMILEYGYFGLPLFIFFLYKLYKGCKDDSDVFRIIIIISTIVVLFFYTRYGNKWLWTTLAYCAIRDKSSINRMKVKRIVFRK